MVVYKFLLTLPFIGARGIPQEQRNQRGKIKKMGDVARGTEKENYLISSLSTELVSRKPSNTSPTMHSPTPAGVPV